MPRITIIVTPQIKELVTKLAGDNGQTESAIAHGWIKSGIKEEIKTQLEIREYLDNRNAEKA
jgi:hypothetical protein